jgi:DNA-binding NarL/FixJ family response regulator
MCHSLLKLQAVLPSPVLVVEDEPLLQDRLHGILLQLGYAPDALLCAASVGEARACLASQPFALALVDLMLPDGSGLDLIAEMRAETPDMGILVVSAWSSEESILTALRAGATGYVLKERDDIEVSMSIRSVLRGGAPIDPFIARRILQLLPLGDGAMSPGRPAADGAQTSSAASSSQQLRPSDPTGAPAQNRSTTLAIAPAATQGESLTEREGQILCLVADGLTNREIAERLFLSRYTVESHIKRIYRKLAVSSRTMAVRAGRARGVIE